MKSTLLRALREAGALLKEALNKRGGFEKKSELSLVTETDHRAEALVIGLIQSEFPDHAILAEESLGRGDSPFRWIIDPLDGTTNFAHTYPVACVSIAFEDHGEVVLGGVYDPFRDELFFAEKDKGAFLNEQKITVSKTASLREALCATGFPYDRRERLDDYLGIIRDYLMKIHGIRRSGSAALDISYVACGRFDGYFEAKLNPWDVAAAGLICREAGGRLSSYAGEPYKINARQTVASNGLIHEEMLETLRPHQKVGLL